MQVFREIIDIESEELVIQVPKNLRKKRVEVIILPINKKTGNEETKKKFSKEIENFLNLGGSGSWEGNLDEMRESRDGIG